MADIKMLAGVNVYKIVDIKDSDSSLKTTQPNLKFWSKEIIKLINKIYIF